MQPKTLSLKRSLRPNSSSDTLRHLVPKRDEFEVPNKTPEPSLSLLYEVAQT